MEILQSAIDLSRLQFAFVVSFHAIFPVFSIGIASFVALLEALFYKTQNPVYARLSEFWTKVFAIAFGMGVVSGIVMSFQFGTNWSNFSYATANFLGPVLSYEVITAFFLEAAFLGVLLFGREKVPSGVHLFAAIMVAVGTFISSFWILAANSWLHTPAGVEVVDGVFHVRDWVAAIFNPSFPYRFAHMGIASFLTGAFVVAGVSSWFLIRGRDVLAHRKALSMCLWLILFLAPSQVLMGDFHGLNTLEYQPAKIAAMEGNWETSSNVPLLLFALPSNETQSNSFELGVPNMASIILKHKPEGIVPGLNETPAHEQPPVAAVFWSFRVMVGLGMLMVLAGIVGLLYRFTKRLYTPGLFHRFLVAMIPAPFIAVVAGWFVTEMGRSPWLVYGMMTQAEGITPSLTPGLALASLIGFGVVYGIVYASGLVYIIKTVRKGTDNESGV
jgi:cytochrome d ubiquinol oxidase subunit I